MKIAAEFILGFLVLISSVFAVIYANIAWSILLETMGILILLHSFYKMGDSIVIDIRSIGEQITTTIKKEPKPYD
jgi:hypothetical protein